MTFKIVRFFEDKLLDEGFGFSYIRFDKYQTSMTGNGIISATGEITITCIDTEVEKQVLENIELDLDDSKEVSDII